MRIFLTLSLLVYLNLPGFSHVSRFAEATLSQQWEEIKNDQEIPHQSSTYDSLGIIELDEDSDLDEAFINCIYAETTIEFKVNLTIPVLTGNFFTSNLITFGTDNSPPPIS